MFYVEKALKREKSLFLPGEAADISGFSYGDPSFDR